jgi:hypothetical protein
MEPASAQRTTQPKISFVIPNWNQKDLLEKCISSIYATTTIFSPEVIVVDNGSTDDSIAFVGEAFPDVRWIRNAANLGFAKATNQGAEAATGDVLLLLNNDVVLLEGCAHTLVCFLENTPGAGAAAPLLCYPDGRLQISCRRFPTAASLLLEFLGINRVGPCHRWKLTAEEHRAGGIVQQPMASVLAVTRACWSDVGPMDEIFPLFFNDVDWCYRLYRYTDYSIYLCPEARALHCEGASTRLLGFRRRIAFFQGLLRFYRKHLSATSSSLLFHAPVVSIMLCLAWGIISAYATC